MVIEKSIGAKLIEKTVTEVSKQQQQVKLTETGESPFKNVLDSISVGEDLAGKLGMSSETFSTDFSKVDAIPAGSIEVSQGNLSLSTSPNGMDAVVDLIHEVNTGQMKMESVMQELLSGGKKFNFQELLAIQAHVYHIAQVTELVVKTADQGVGSIKAVLNTNIQ